MTVCAKCNRQMRPVTNGVTFIELDSTGEPYKLYMGDLVECQDCGARMIVGVPLQPLAYAHHSNWNEVVVAEKPLYHAKEFSRG